MSGAAPDDAAFIKAEIIMATIPKRPAGRGHMPRDDATRLTLKIATGKANRTKPDPHRLNKGQQARPITLPSMPWDADKRG
jgi:hypothetical protein